MSKALIALFFALSASHAAYSQTLGTPAPGVSDSEESPVKYSIYSSAWGTRSNAGLRLVAQNLSDHELVLQSILFQDEEDALVDNELDLDLSVPPHAWADIDLPYVDLLFGSECIGRIMQEDWKLVEISNYTLNPSVRGLIIEDTDSFRIYQCVRNVQVSWMDTTTGDVNNYTEWVLYHFERQLVN
ncbi:MAG: hypothetical protein ACSHXZ_12425 [Gammaproteobacteria bacterium]